LTLSVPSLEASQRASCRLLCITCSVRRQCTRSHVFRFDDAGGQKDRLCSHPRSTGIALPPRPRYCLMPEPVGVPPTFCALTYSAPSLVLIQRVSSGLFWVICKVRK